MRRPPLARHDGASLRAAEEQRDRAQQAIIAELRRRYVDGPVLVVPRAGSGSVNNAGATVVPGAGTVFRALATKGAWGSFDAPGGALISADGETVSLPAPVIVDATTLKGDGWTATVGPGWTVQPGRRPGSVPRRAAMTTCRVQRREFLLDGGRAALGFGALFLSACSSRTPNAPKDAFLESLVAAWEAGIPQWLQETKMPAVSIAIIRDGQLAWRRAFGVKDTGTNEPVDIDSVFAACSDTKPVFAYGVLKLCEKGVLNLDTPLTKYTSRRITADPRVELITARHVLNHTTGFPNWRQGPELPIEFDAGLAESGTQAKVSAICSRWSRRSPASRSKTSCATTCWCRWG